jgi:hypothetical protein
MNNLISIKGSSIDDIKKVLWQWIDLYITELQDGMTFEIYKNRELNHLIKVDNRLSNKMFFILIDYLKYHDAVSYDIQKRGFTKEIRRILDDGKIRNNVKIKGFITGQDDNILKGKRLLVNMPTVAAYRAYEHFLITTDEGENYKIDFAGKVTASDERREFKQPDNIVFQNPDILTVRPADFANELRVRTEWQIGKRFKPIAFIALALFFLGHISFLSDLNLFLMFFGSGLFAWFISDYKMLQSDRYYLYCLLISIVFCGYCMLVGRFFDDSISFWGSLIPLNLLVVQKPTRQLYKSLFKREPVIERPVKRFADIVYMMILLFGSIFSTIAIVLMLK